MTRRVLIVDDDPVIRASLAEALADDGITVSVAEDGARALAMLADTEPDVVLSDVRMPDVGGLALQDLLRERAPEVDVILMTAFDDMPTVVSAMRGGAVEFLVKPVSLSKLRQVMTRVFQDRRLRKRAAANGETDAPPGDFLIGRDERMIDVYKLVGQAAATRATVLIRGESGTGKELIARAIHANSHAAREPFVPVNCAAVPSTLLESELFGHVRGAFTGAHETRRGRFALAGKGTIFLDEIGDTSLDFQSKLLRVIQDREFQPVGAERTEKTEARVLAATHQNLEQMVADKRFREDLYYRLRVVEIVIPPLRERRSDIPLIAKHMVKRAGASLGTSEPVLSDEALDRLIEHHWPGNVRELENCVLRAVVIAAGNVIRPEHLSIASPSRPTAAPLTSLEQIEREHLTRVLAATEGHKGRAAEILGVSRPRLGRLLKKYELE
ncbi:MAG TPA: sigma-54 dependent transcriptional regulator [Gemmatimonadaceae bacterium]|nr:sigma-54 dependent transcriptional regulator [Gemmatimonadaceae bacterium]